MASHHDAQSAAGDDDGEDYANESILGGNASNESSEDSSANENDSSEDDPEQNDLQDSDVEEEEPESPEERLERKKDPSVTPDILESDNDDEAASFISLPPKEGKSKSNSKDNHKLCRQKCEALKKQWNDEVNRLKKEHKEEVRQLRAEISRLRKENEALRKKAGGIKWKAWDPDLLAFLSRFRERDPHDEDRDYLDEYRPIHLESYRQGNMSVVATHPDLHIVEEFCTRARIQRHFADQRVHTPNNAALSAAFPFERLPIAVQSRIWKLLVPYCELIHCLSHLDYLNPPLDNDLNPTTKHFYPSRFHIGDGPCCVALADKPSTYLEYLCVSKRWFYALAHQFYGTNTFAFSSLGELGRFFDGIGIARAERVVHVELLWHGTLAPRQTTGVSRRTKPLAWFMHTSRLRTLLVHINESGNSRMRRPYEMLREDDFYRDFGDENYATHEAEDKMDIFQMEAQRTDLQQNYRKYRSMRTVQGMDYIYQLRGMKWVRFYDTHAEKPCTLIRDKSFLSDITNTTTTKKSDSMALKSEIDNLRPLTLLEDYIPDDQTAELVASFYDDTSVDDVSVADSDMSSSDGSSDSDSDSDSDDDDDSSSGYSSGSSCRVPKGYGRKNKNSTSVTDGGDNMDDDENRPGDVSEPIVIPGDDDNHRRRRRGRDQDISTSDELFVRSGSCTAHTDHDSDDEVTVVTQSSSFVDLTVDDDECYIMDVDDAISVPKEEDEIKTEVLPDDDEEEYLFVKSEESTFQGLSPNAPEFDSDSRSIQSSKRSPSEDNLD